MEYVRYEDFGAVGNGINDDMPAIVKAHEYANEHNLKVKVTDGATYYIGPKNMCAVIKTDVDFGCATFIIDDVDIEDRKAHCFSIESDNAPYTPDIHSLRHDQSELAFDHDEDTYVRIFSDEHKIFVRHGVNANAGVDITDCFVVGADGKIKTKINYDYTAITKAVARKIDTRPITVKGGKFITVANQWKNEYAYHGRNFIITRDNVTVENVTHKIFGEGEHGAPYEAFFLVSEAVNVTIRDCLLTPHKTYVTYINGDLNKPSSMGSYDLNFTAAINTRLINITQSIDINDNRYWGLMGSNFCKDFYLENCVMSRFDAHMGVTNVTIKGSTFGHMSLQLIGTGDALIEDSVAYGNHFVNLRADYGSIWDGNLTIRNCVWHPRNPKALAVIGAQNKGEHDFGYVCRMPENIVIDGMRVCDGEFGESATLYALPNYDPTYTDGKPYPYVPPKTVEIANIVSESGKKYLICANAAQYKSTIINAK